MVRAPAAAAVTRRSGAGSSCPCAADLLIISLPLASCCHCLAVRGTREGSVRADLPRAPAASTLPASAEVIAVQHAAWNRCSMVASPAGATAAQLPPPPPLAAAPSPTAAAHSACSPSQACQRLFSYTQQHGRPRSLCRVRLAVMADGGHRLDPHALRPVGAAAGEMAPWQACERPGIGWIASECVQLSHRCRKPLT